MNEPLGIDAASQSPPTRYAASATRLAVGLAATAGLGAAFALWRYFPEHGGRPFAVAHIEKVEAPAWKPLEPPLAAQPSAAHGAGASAADVEAASGVKVVRNGGGTTTNALIIDVTQSLGVRLSPAPDARLVEKSRFGLLPRVGVDGARPSEIYARPVVGSLKLADAPRIAILVGGVGLDAETTNAAISQLPAAISLGLAPYGEDLERAAARARAAGHEILLQSPMEPLGASANPGPHMLVTAATEDENRASLHWQMGRFVGYVGVTNYLGGKFTAEAKAFSPVLADIASRGLFYLDDGSSPRSLAGQLAPGVNLSESGADVALDAAPSADAIEAALTRLEAAARRRGAAIGTATALPISVEHIAHWAASLEARGIALAPVSALISRGPTPSARSAP